MLSILECDNYIWIGGAHGKLRYYNSKKGTFDGIMTPASLTPSFWIVVDNGNFTREIVG